MVLEFIVKYLDYDLGTWSYFFYRFKTFDLYKKYSITPINLYKDFVTEEQWEYMYG